MQTVVVPHIDDREFGEGCRKAGEQLKKAGYRTQALTNTQALLIENEMSNRYYEKTQVIKLVFLEPTLTLTFERLQAISSRTDYAKEVLEISINVNPHRYLMRGICPARLPDRSPRHVCVVHSDCALLIRTQIRLEDRRRC